ncbi:MAG TPA: inorganic phosphate transporter [Candidatus Anammoximicrobium sp.]|nr:inorganic phosphate transporter [Candidatus Anammoximicrobium sp.]
MDLLADAPWTLIAADAGSVPLSMGTGMLVVVLVTIFVALVFDFLNGFHDAANSIATVVSTRVLSPRLAVAWAAFFNFAAAFLFGTHVAKTIGTGLVETSLIDVYVVCGGLLGAITWNIITWLLGLPTSSSHALVAGIAGAAIAKGGFTVLILHGWVLILLGIVLSPALGFALGSLNLILVSWLFRRATPHKVDRLFRRLQLVSAALYSLGHGGNDAQKTMGIIVLLLTAAGLEPWTTWGQVHLFGLDHAYGMPIILSCNFAIALGTMFGGWRIVKTVGSSITRLQPVGGFCAETAAAIAIMGFTKIGGVPISTTHAITGAILGVGSTRRVRSVRWIWGERIVLAWVLTIPCSAFIGMICYVLMHWLVEPWI